MKQGFVAVMAFLLAACGASTTPQPDASVVAANQRRLGADELLSRVSVLPPQKLEVGECGLFLWMKRDDAPLLMFQKARSDTANMVLDGKLVSLQRQTAEQPVMSVFYEKQTFEANGFKLGLSVKTEHDAGIRGGLKIPSGTLSLQTNEGWSGAIPVAGVIGCQ